MPSCSGIKADGGRCRAQAIRGSEWCFNHHPDYEEQRRRRGAKGGKRGGRGRPQAELFDLKRDVRKVIDDVLAGEVSHAPGAVALQGYNTLLRAAKVELDIREQQELIERLEALERAGGTTEDEEERVLREALRRISTDDLRLVHAYLERAAEGNAEPAEEEEAAILRYEALKAEVRNEH